jgi:hypothetical protein
LAVYDYGRDELFLLLEKEIREHAFLESINWEASLLSFYFVDSCTFALRALHELILLLASQDLVARKVAAPFVPSVLVIIYFLSSL